MRLANALKTLPALLHDELTDLIDLMDFWDNKEGVHQRRKGKTPIERIEYEAGEGLQNAITACRALRKRHRPLIRDSAVMLRDALAPQEYRKRSAGGEVKAHGSIQAKYIKKKYVDENGNPWIDPDTGEQGYKISGPYLYLRVWATGGGRDRRQKRLKNKYIGRTNLAQAFVEGLVTAEEILNAYYGKTLDELEAVASDSPSSDIT